MWIVKILWFVMLVVLLTNTCDVCVSDFPGGRVKPTGIMRVLLPIQADFIIHRLTAT